MKNIPQPIGEEIKRLRTIVDGTGRPIDEGILLLVAALQHHGFTTVASCEGHAKRHKEPWVEVQSSDAPELLKLMQEGPHSGPDFIQNRTRLVEANRKENTRLYALLTDFYKSHQPGYSTILTIAERGPGYGRLMPHAAYLVDKNDEKLYANWLAKTQAETEVFADFLVSTTI